MKQKVYVALREKAQKIIGRRDNLPHGHINGRLRTAFQLYDDDTKENIFNDWAFFLNSLDIKAIQKRRNRKACWIEKVGSQEKVAKDKDHIIINDPFFDLLCLCIHERHGLKVPKELVFKISVLGVP